MHIMIYNKIVIFRNYITTCLWKKKKGTVITYCEASKKYPNKCYWQHNNIKNNFFKKRRKDYKDDRTRFQWVSCENPGSLASTSPGAMEGAKGALKGGRVWSLGEQKPSTGSLYCFRFPGRKDRELHWGTLLIYPWLSTEAPRLWGRGGLESGGSARQVMAPANSSRRPLWALQELAEVETSTQAFILPIGNTEFLKDDIY